MHGWPWRYLDGTGKAHSGDLVKPHLLFEDLVLLALRSGCHTVLWPSRSRAAEELKTTPSKNHKVKP
jgi:hypothetical protein